MLLSTLILFSLLCRASYSITCYECSARPDDFGYIITADRIPPEIQNCSFVVNQTSCLIDLSWQFTLGDTRIDILRDPDQKQAIHTLRATALQTGYGVIGQWQHSFEYRCSTDRCNDISRFVLLLKSLTLQSNFTPLNDLIEPQVPFSSSWCRLASNRTADDCPDPSTVNPTNCQQCLAKFTADRQATTLCSSCVTRSDEQEEQIETEMTFNLMDRTEKESWTIYCSAPDCNGLQTDNRIRAARIIAFDFDQFLGPKSSAQRLLFFSLQLCLPFVTQMFIH